MAANGLPLRGFVNPDDCLAVQPPHDLGYTVVTNGMRYRTNVK
jgi:hypothetical protein